jgi:Holliday junction resolvase
MGKPWKTFEYATLNSFAHMVEEYPDLWGAGFRRRQAFGGQGFDVIFESNLGRFLIECKTKSLTEQMTGREKFYVGQAIRDEQFTELLEYAVGMGAVPLFAFGVFGPKRGERRAWLVHAEDVARMLLRSHGITIAEIAEYGLSLPKMRAGELKKPLYKIEPGLLKVLAADYREKTSVLEVSGVWEWARRKKAPPGINLKQMLRRGHVWA